MPQPSVVPPLLNSSATAANRFFERRSSRTTRTCGSPNTPRTLAAARKPGSEYPSDSRRRRCFDLAILQHAKIERIPNLKKALIHKLICRYNPLKSPTRLPEDPFFRSGSCIANFLCTSFKSIDILRSAKTSWVAVFLTYSYNRPGHNKLFQRICLYRPPWIFLSI